MGQRKQGKIDTLNFEDWTYKKCFSDEMLI